MQTPAHAPALAAHRFGLGEARLDTIGRDPLAWVLGQWAAPQAFDASGLPDGAEALALTRAALRAVNTPGPDNDRQALVQANQRALQRRWAHMVGTATPVHERWVQFWANHFTVAATKGATLGVVWPYEREAIRPHVDGRFTALLRAATLHPAMLLYLDNAQSVGPGSPAGRRRERGLNENHARELLELHTVGVHAGYTQADVTELARLLTGWTVEPGTGVARYVPARHEPGDKRVMGRRYAEGPQALDAVLEDLATHPATAQHLAQRLVRHFVADTPPEPLVRAVARRCADTGGDLRQTARALFDHELAWQAHAPGKARTPEELHIAAHRLLGRPVGPAQRWTNALAALGQPPGRAPSPQGWPDTEADWLGADALRQRVAWAVQLGEQAGPQTDARALAREAFGAALSERTRTEIERADSGAQALALLLASPEMQRR
ncbi:MAG: DUF1800 domain-containing protein [Hydrogenophaga sp.]|uniref:DUF1800 domain-containing protein n=1 Tax=Hydrogenophaga sp. TaxID=1904254 RepID=UPI00257E7BD6|nr:DUF1800 domain-containing protein [Hydrogenophaga sp.]MBL0945029.1 DUF1800 domain-containing protein [Hydrogenophaga sp.]